MTDWNVLCNAHGQHIDGLTVCITDSTDVHFCMDSVIPTKTVHNKPWVIKDIKAALKKNAAFRSGDKEEMKKAQIVLRVRSVTEGNLRGNFSRRTSGRCGVA